MKVGASTRIFAIVTVALGGLAGLKALDATDRVIDIMTLTDTAFAAGDEADHSADAEDAHADADGAEHGAEGVGHDDPRGPLDIFGEDDHDEPAEVASAAAACPTPPSLAERSGLSLSELQVLRSLSDRRRDLDAREDSLVEREGLLAAAEARVESRIEELRGLEASIEDLLGQLDEAEESQINALVALYSRMKSDDAARIFSDLDGDIRIAVAGRMSEQALAPILADMPAREAAALTVALARRHVAPSTLEALEARGGEGG